MGWRSTGAAFRAGNYSGPLTSNEGGFAAGFAQTFTAGISKAADIITEDMKADREHEREKDLIRLRETLAAQRAGASSSRTSDAETAKQLAEAKAFAAQHDIPLEDAFTRLAASDWDGSQAGNALSEEREKGDIATGLVPDVSDTSSDDTSSAITPAEVPSVTPQTIPAPVETASVVDDLLATEPEAEPDPLLVASRGDTMTDVPIPLISATDTGMPLVERAAEVVAEVASGEVPAGSEPITYDQRVAAGETPAAAAAVVAEGFVRVPELFRLPSLTEITTLEQALAIRDTLQARRQYLGATDDFYRNYAPVLEQRIQSLSVEGLPDLGDMAQQNNRDLLEEFASNGWRAFEGTVDPDTLNNHRRRAEELLASGKSMPNIPANVDELRAMGRDVQAGVYGADVPTEWQGQLNSALAEAEFRTNYRDRLTVDFIYDDARTVRELTGLLNSATSSLPPGDPVIRDLQEALRLRGEMPDAVPIPGSLREAEIALARAIENGADQAVIDRLTVDRDAARAADRSSNPVGITDGEYRVLLNDGRFIRARLQEDGTFLVPGGDVIPQDQVQRTLSSEQRQEAVAEITRFRDDRLIPTRGQRQALVTMLPVAMRVADRLERNRGLLTTVGTTIPQLFTRVGAELSAITDLASRFGGDPSVPNSLVDPDLFRQSVMSSLGDMSSDASQHAADVIFLAYQIALSQNDRVTDQDFRTALQQIASGSTPEGFIPNLLNRVDDQIRSHDAMVTAALKAPEIRLYIDEYGEFPGYSLDELQPFSDFAVSAGFSAELERFNALDARYRGDSSAAAPDPDQDPVSFTVGEYTLNQRLADLIRSQDPTPDQIKNELIGRGGFTEDQVRTFFPEIFEESQ